MVKWDDSLVMVLDDDTAILGGLNRLLTLHGYQVCLLFQGR